MSILSILKSGWFRCIGIVSLLISTFSLMLYISYKFPEVSIIFLSVWLFGWLLGYSMKKNARHAHILILVLDIIFTIIMVLLLSYLILHYQQWYGSLSIFQQQIIDQLVQLVYQTIPNTSLVAYILFTIIYCLLLMILRVIAICLCNHIGMPQNSILSILYDIAYIDKEQKRYMLPRFKFARPFGLALISIAVMLVAWYFWQYKYGTLPISLIYWLMIFLVVIGADWLLWLSGDLASLEKQPIFEGGDGEPTPNDQNFEELWRRYHRFWQDKWLVAGNKSTGVKSDA